MTILVTGTAGFIGFHTAKKLLERGDNVIGLDNFNDYYDPKLKEDRNSILEGFENFKLYRGNFEDEKLIKKIFTDNSIEKVCHLGAQAGVRYSIENPKAYVNSNLVGFSNLIEEAKNYKVKNFVYASSSSVYGGNKKTPFSVEDRTDNPISLYAATKKSNELIANTYSHLFKLNTAGLRFFTVYGPWGRPDMALFLFVDTIYKDKPIKVFNNGQMKRNFTYIDDIVAGTISAIDKPLGCKILNIGNNKTVKLMHFIEVIENTIGKKAEKEMMPLQPGDVPNTIANIEETKRLLNFDPKTNIDEGVPKFIDWYKKYYKL